jgi:hypothetical protein
MPPRVILLTQPKAGTYLISEILRRLGLHQTYYHLGLDSLDAYDRHQLDQGRREPRRYRAAIPIEQAARIIRTGEFAVGHLPCCDRAADALADFRLVFCRREQRAALVSCMRFHHQTGRPAPGAGQPLDERPRARTAEFLRRSGPKLVEQARRTLDWADHPGVLPLRFEDVRARPAAAAAQIAGHLGLPCPDPARIAHELESADTLTCAAAPTALDHYWSGEAEAIFTGLGGPQLNAAAGYPADAPAFA